MRELRIHHFFDIIRDYGSGKVLNEHIYGHSYHKIAAEIYENKLTEIKLIIKCDDICENCSKLSNGICTDSINHRLDFSSKEKFNNYLDSKIMKCLEYEEDHVIDIKKIIIASGKYLESIFYIYDGNDIDHTKMRQKNVTKGIERKIIELGITE